MGQRRSGRTRTRRVIGAALGALFFLVGAGCPPSDDEPRTRRSGTLRLAVLTGYEETAALDPTTEFSSVGWELFRCCLLRTLMAQDARGRPVPKLVPDLAEAPPTASPDGRTWTFRMRRGLRYAPPFENTEIVAGDVVRALRRAADPALDGGYSYHFSVIEGFDEVALGDASTISGVRVVGSHTLVVRLLEPRGDLPSLFGLPATAPIPEGAAPAPPRGYGRSLVSSGPYMIAGAAASGPSRPAPGYDPGRSLLLVRNPSWDPRSDLTRPAFVDRIEVRIGGDAGDLGRKVERADVDAVLAGVPPPAAQIARYRRDPTRRRHLHVAPRGGNVMIAMNVAQPPLDDVHVRRAVNLAVDKTAFRRLEGGPVVGELAGHIVPDALLRGVLRDFDPFATPGGRGSIEAARREVRASRYDRDADGRCDAPVCRNVVLVTSAGQPSEDQAALVAERLRSIGLDVSVRADATGDPCFDPAQHIAMCLPVTWVAEYPDPLPFLGSLFGSDAIGPEGCCNAFLVGASRELLRRNGYAATVPSVDDDLTRCAPLAGAARVRCLARLDRRVTAEIVPAVPLLFANHVAVTSRRVTRYRFDPFAAHAAPDQMAVRT